MRLILLYLISMSFLSCQTQSDQRMQIRSSIDTKSLSEGFYTDTLRIGVVLSKNMSIGRFLTDKRSVDRLWQVVSQEYNGRDYVVKEVEGKDDSLIYYELDDHLKVYILGLNHKGGLEFIEKKELKTNDLYIPENH